jgi:porphobilinogen synthase
MSSTLSSFAAFPAGRPRRLRRDAFTRNLVRENALTTHDLIYPVFVQEGSGRRDAVASMPGVERLSLDLLLPVAEQCVAAGIPVMALFPVIDASLKTPSGDEAFNPDGLIPRVVAALKARFPELGVMTDVALDPYTSHGQDGLLDDSGYILNDPTVEVLVKQALTQSQAGARRSRRAATCTRGSWPTAPSTRAPSTARSATRSARPPTSARATRRSTRWTRATATRRCARWRSTSPRAPTW